MKRVLFLLMAVALSSCATVNRSDTLPEDQLFQTRKYVGLFLDYDVISPAKFGSAPIMLIRTEAPSMYKSRPVITVMNMLVYSRRCDYILGDRLYIRRILVPISSLESTWAYYLECDGKHNYRLRQFQYDDKILIQTWF